MKTIGFIGAYDKSDLIIYIAKLLTAIEKRVLIVDATILQKVKYIVPNISPAKSYITNFEEIDIAVGFESLNMIKEYLGFDHDEMLDYDYILVDTDIDDAIHQFGLKAANQNYFVTGFDSYSLKRGLELLSGVNEPLSLKRVMFTEKMTEEEEEYFDYLSLGTKAIWQDESIYFLLEEQNQSAIIENQRVEKIKFKKMTDLYKQNLLYLANELVDERQEMDMLKRALKQLEKGV